MRATHLILLLTFLNHAGVNASRVLLALYLLEFGAQPLTMGVLAGAFSFFPALLAVPIGQLVDRWGARFPMLFGSCFGLTGLLLAYFLPGMPAIFAGAIMVSMAMAIWNVSTQNLVGLLSSPEDRPRNFSNYSLANATASFVGPLIAGFSIDHLGHALACIVIALIFVVPLTILALHKHAAFGRGSSRQAHKKGRFVDLLVGPGMLLTLLMGSLQNLGDVLYSFYMPVYTHSLGLSASVIGVILAMNAAAAFVVRMVIPGMLKRFGEPHLMACAFCLGGGALILIPLFDSAIMLALLSFMFGLGMGCTGPIITMLMFANSPPGRSGEALGLKVTFNHVTKVISPVILGSVAAAYGLLPVFWITAVMMGGGGWLSKKLPTANTSEKT